MFVAVWPTAEVVAALAAMQREDVKGLRWTPAERWHVTLRFLGEVPDEQVAPLGRALEDAVEGRLPCRATLGPATVRLGRTVLTVPVAGLDPLGEAVIDATRGFGSPPEDRRFVGHVTLARGRGGRPVPAHVAGSLLQAGWDVTEVTLVRSRLGRDGPTYDVVFTA